MNNSGLPLYRFQLCPDLLKLKDLDQNYCDVVTQVYPLRAQASQLAAFCDKYLNFDNADDHPMFFKPAAPWVLAQVCNYGEMALKRLHTGQGWFSQHELAFGIPVEWYNKADDGSLVFQDWAMIYPFIYVDNPLSMAGGREVYGWAKAGIVVDDRSPEFDPNEPRCLVSISRKVYAQPLSTHPRSQNAAVPSHEQSNVDDQSSLQPFFQVSQRRPVLSGRAGVGNALAAIPGVVGSYLTAASGILDLMSNAVARYEDPGFRGLLPLLTRWFGYLSKFVPSSLSILFGAGAASSDSANALPGINIVTLKQFRDAEDRELACYQAIVCSRMKIDRAIDGGLLFDPLSADANGGVQITMAADSDLDIVAQLGIDNTVNSGPTNRLTYSLRPLMPFWAKVDLSYGAAHFQSWRAPGAFWSDTEELKLPAPVAKPTTVAAAKPAPLEAASQPAKSPSPVRYLHLGGGSGQELQMPLKFKPITAYFLMLNAEAGPLQRLINKYLENDYFAFYLPSFADQQTTVWAVVSDFSLSAQGSKACYRDRALVLMVPIEWSEVGGATRLPAMIPLYNFVGTDWSFITETEVYGRFSIKSTLASPPNSWLEIQQKKEKTALFEVSTHLFPDQEILQAGRSAGIPKGASPCQLLQNARVRQALRDETVMTIRSGPASEARTVAKPAGRRQPRVNLLLEELHLAPSYHDKPFYTVALKQIRDAMQGDRACYRSLVGVKRQLTITENTEMEMPVSIEICRHKSLGALENLGLARPGGKHRVTLEPEKCVSVTGEMDDIVAQNLCVQRGASKWEKIKWKNGENPFDGQTSPAKRVSNSRSRGTI